VLGVVKNEVVGVVGVVVLGVVLGVVGSGVTLDVVQSVEAGVASSVVWGVVNNLIADSSNKIQIASNIVIISGLGGVLGFCGGYYLWSVL
jgi:hypothetical protein